jgi:hypothetical protein
MPSSNRPFTSCGVPHASRVWISSDNHDRAEARPLAKRTSQQVPSLSTASSGRPRRQLRMPCKAAAFGHEAFAPVGDSSGRSHRSAQPVAPHGVGRRSRGHTDIGGAALAFAGIATMPPSQPSKPPGGASQSLAVTPSRRCAKRSRACSRRVGRCSLGTSSRGGPYPARMCLATDWRCTSSGPS